MSTYFDNGATTYIYPEVIDVIGNMMKYHWYNPNSLYSLGIETRNLINEARETIATLLHCEPNEIIFTGSASESNAFVINNFDICFASPYNHHDIKDNNKTIVWWGNELSEYNIANALFAIPYVNNETGEIFDIQAYTQKAHNRGYKILVDATQALGNIEIYPHDLDVDFMSFSMHKVHGPKIGLLYVSQTIQQEMQLKPLIFGTQEFHLRGSTEDTVNIVGAALALKMAMQEMSCKTQHCQKLRELIIETLKTSDIDFRVNQGTNNISSILNLAFKNIIGEVLMLTLDEEGFYTSVGAACDSGNHEPSETLLAMGVPYEYIAGELRISMSLQNTEEDAVNLAHAIIKSYKQIIGN